MRCADDALLWQYAEDGLVSGERAGVEEHLSTCDRCAAALARIGATRSVLRAASAARPAVKWRQVDEAVMAAATARVARAQRLSPAWGLAGLVATAALALAVWAPWRSVEPNAPIPPVAEASPSAAPADVHVESAEGALFAEGAGLEQVLERGLALHEGARIRTDAQGSALVRLPEASRARLGPRTDAVLARAAAEAVEIRLRRGAVVVQASHAARERFVIEAPEASIRVIGTVFRVARHEGQVVVAVEEGRVLVEPRGGGQSRFIDAGQRLVLGPKGSVLEEVPLAAEDRAAFAQLPDREPTPPSEPEPVSEPQRAPTTPAHQPPVQQVRPVPVAQAPTPEAPLPAAPGMAISELEIPDFGSSPAEQAARPAKKRERATSGGLPTTAEALFLRRAEDALRTGGCGGYLLGLADITETSEDPGARETARILRARCFDDRLEPVRAEAEYRKYLQRFPAGRFAGEARGALNH